MESPEERRGRRMFTYTPYTVIPLVLGPVIAVLGIASRDLALMAVGAGAFVVGLGSVWLKKRHDI